MTVFLDSGRLKALQWLRETDIGKFRQLLEVFEHDADDLSIFSNAGLKTVRDSMT